MTSYTQVTLVLLFETFHHPDIDTFAVSHVSCRYRHFAAYSSLRIGRPYLAEIPLFYTAVPCHRSAAILAITSNLLIELGAKWFVEKRAFSMHVLGAIRHLAKLVPESCPSRGFSWVPTLPRQLFPRFWRRFWKYLLFFFFIWLNSFGGLIIESFPRFWRENGLNVCRGGTKKMLSWTRSCHLF